MANSSKIQGFLDRKRNVELNIIRMTTRATVVSTDYVVVMYVRCEYI